MMQALSMCCNIWQHRAVCVLTLTLHASFNSLFFKDKDKTHKLKPIKVEGRFKDGLSAHFLLHDESVLPVGSLENSG